MTALNEGDAEAVRQIFDVAGSVVSSDTADDDDRVRESGRWATWALLETSAEVMSCAVLSSGPTRCEVTRTSAFDATSDNPQTLVLQVRASSGGVVELLRIDLGAGLWVDVESEFGVWVRESQPADYIPMFVDFSDPERTADLWRDLYPAWAAGDA